MPAYTIRDEQKKETGGKKENRGERSVCIVFRFGNDVYEEGEGKQPSASAKRLGGRRRDKK